MPDPIIEVAGLTKAYGATAVLRGVELHADEGQVLAVLGPNGAGKTTTVRILATLTAADAGSVRIAGADVRTDPAAVRRRIALTGQYAALDGTQTGRENLLMMSRLSGLGRRASIVRADELLERFDLVQAGRRRVETYSGGMRRRLDLAASLVGRPSVIFLDEPTTGLDPRSRLDLWAVVAELAAEGTTVLLTTQYLEEADQLADRIAVIDGGVVVADGTAAELKRRVAGSRLELTCQSSPAYDELARRLGAQATGDGSAHTLSVPIEDDARAVRRLLDDADPDGSLVARFALRHTSLDDVFLSLTARDTRPEELLHV